MTDLSPDAVIDLLILDRMTETFAILQTVRDDADRARLLAALGAVRNALAHGHHLAPGDELAVVVEGAAEEAVIRACLADLERTSLGAPTVRVVRAQASARRVADVLLRYQQAATPGAWGPAPSPIQK